MTLYDEAVIAARLQGELGELAMQQAGRIVHLEVENEQLRRTVEDLRQQLKAPPY